MARRGRRIWSLVSRGAGFLLVSGTVIHHIRATDFPTADFDALWVALRRKHGLEAALTATEAHSVAVILSRSACAAWAWSQCTPAAAWK